MTPLIILGAIAGTVLLLSILFRINAVFLFIGVAAGSLLANSLSDDADLVIGSVAKSPDSAMIAPLVLMALPVLYVIIFLRKTIPAHKIIFQFVPLIATGLMLAVLLLPLLPEPMSAEINKSEYGELINTTKDVVVGVAVISTLFLAWFSYHHKGEGKKGKKGKK